MRFRRRALRAGGAGVMLALGLVRPAPAPAGWNTLRTVPVRDTLRVVTLNLWHDQHDWPKRLGRIVGELRARRPDVICLQEVLQHPGLPNQAATLAESLGYASHFVSVDGEDRPKRYGNAILTRLPVLGRGGHFLLPLDDYRVVAHLRVSFHGVPLDVYDTHLHHTREGGTIRAEQVRDLVAFVASTRGEGGLVLAGDFNTELGSAELSPIEATSVDAFRATHPRATHAESVTLNALLGNEPLAIDHLFVMRRDAVRLEPLGCEILFREAGPDSVWASDHFGVAADFLVRGRAVR